MNYYETRFIKKRSAHSPREAADILMEHGGYGTVDITENDSIEVVNLSTKEVFIFKIIRGKVIETHKKSRKLRNKILSVIDYFNHLRTGNYE